MLTGLIFFAAVALTCTMFATREYMLGFPSALFWAILGGYAYTQSTVPWGDWQYYLFFASVAGMVPFCMFGAYALRKSKKAEARDDEFLDEGKDDSKYIDEDAELDRSVSAAFDGDEDGKGNLKKTNNEDEFGDERPKRRKKVRYGEFK